MKKTIILLFVFNFCLSQQKTIKASYELIREKNGYSFTADGYVLVDNKSKKSIFKLSQYNNLLKNAKKVFDKEENDSIVVVGSTSICTDDKEYYFDFKNKLKKQILYNVNCKSKVLIEEKLTYPKWEILNEFKEISGYKTQKAIATINDRIWTVYFTKDLKENIAPWNLIGLPGAIIEANENSSVYNFKLLKIEYINVENEIVIPSFKTKLSFEEFVKKAVKQNREEMIFKLSQLEGVDAENIEPDTFPLYETLDFIENRKLNNE